MKVYVLSGREWWNEGVYDYDGNHFTECYTLGVYENLDNAKDALKQCVKAAVEHVAETFILGDTSTIQSLLNDDGKCENVDEFLCDYGFEDDSTEEIFWTYYESDSRVTWEMFCNLADWDATEPILPVFEIREMEVKLSK